MLNSIVDSKLSNGHSNLWSICLEGLRNNVDGVLWSWATSIFYWFYLLKCSECTRIQFLNFVFFDVTESAGTSSRLVTNTPSQTLIKSSETNLFDPRLNIESTTNTYSRRPKASVQWDAMNKVFYMSFHVVNHAWLLPLRPGWKINLEMNLIRELWSEGLKIHVVLYASTRGSHIDIYNHS